MRVSLAPRRLRSGPPPGWSPEPAPPLLAAQGARVALGGRVDGQGLAQPIAPGPTTMFGRRGAALAEADGTPADVAPGQADFRGGLANRGSNLLWEASP